MKKWKTLSKLPLKADQPWAEKAADIVRILLENRGVRTKKEIDEFLNPRLESVTLKSVGINTQSIRKAIKRINEAIKNNETIVIYGDYDVDGIAGTAILWETLFQFYKNVHPYIPHRVDEGYGLSIKGIQNLIRQMADKIQNIGLIITVDNGIVARKAVEFAKKNNIDVVLTDHHVAPKKLPPAYAIVHTTKLCGAGVAYMLAQEILRSPATPHPSRVTPRVDNHLELVALATVADLVPLVGPNRTLLKFGLNYLRKTKRVGFEALFEEAGIKREEIEVYEIGHIIAPRLNAAGRISHALDSLRLICTKDNIRARQLAKHLGEINKNRQLLTEELTIHADYASKKTSAEKLIFVHHTTYDQGVIGLVASRLAQKYSRPAVVVSEGEGHSKGSARSVAGFNIIEFLRSFSHMLVDAGGHPMAAGFTIETQRIEEFKTVLIKSASAQIADELLVKTLKIDLEIDFPIISQKLYDQIQKLAPFGMGNPEPVFMSSNVSVENLKMVGRDSKHLKLALKQQGTLFDAIAFNYQDKNLKTGDKLKIVYSIDNNIWNGRSRLQLKVKDVKRTSAQNSQE